MLVTMVYSDPSQVESATFWREKDPDEVTTSTMMVALDDDFGADGSFSRATTIPDSFAGGTPNIARSR